MKAWMINNIINTCLDDIVHSYSENVCVRPYVCDFQKGVDSIWEQFSETFNAYLNTLGEMNQHHTVGQPYNVRWNKR